MHPRHVYVHVPFCARRCAYCDFAIAVRARVPVDEYLGALAGELGARFGAPRSGAERWPVDTLYFGGGTPSRLGATGVARAVSLLREYVELAAGAEVTLEANPDDVTPESVAGWGAAGVNRLSLGSQSFHGDALRWMRRTHDAEQIVRAVEHARAGGIDNLSLDLIFALPGAVARSWEADVDRALALRPSHLSLYGLTVEPATPLARWVGRGALAEADEHRYAEEFATAHDRLTAAGYHHYEVSSYALPGRESRHNAAYWSGAPYLGLGPSAHGFDGTTRRWNVRDYAAWAQVAAAGRDPIDGSETLDAQARAAETVYLGLRTAGGLALRERERAITSPWIEAGWATEQSGRLHLTNDGWLRLDAIAASLTLARSR